VFFCRSSCLVRFRYFQCVYRGVWNVKVTFQEVELFHCVVHQLEVYEFIIPSDGGVFSLIQQVILECGPVFRLPIKEDIACFGHCGKVHFIVKRFCVSMVVRFIVAILIVCFSACSASCFCVFSVNTVNSFFIFLYTVSCLLILFYLLSGEGDVCSFSSGGGLAPALFGV
jgi:hypothetical protein